MIIRMIVTTTKMIIIINDHGDLDDADADLIEGDVEQGASGKALQDSNGQQVAATRLQHYCIQIKFFFTLFQ